MGFTLIGMASLAFASNYAGVLIAAALIGAGSSIFHPESSRIARLASGGRHGLAQSIFQVGGNAGSAVGPLLAAWIIIPHGQSSLAWFTLAALLAIAVLAKVGGWYKRRHIDRSREAKARPAPSSPVSPRTVAWSIAILVILIFSKYFYIAGITSYYSFYLMEKFHLSVQSAQIHLFIFLLAMALGTLVGGPIGDRIGRKRVIWVSILGVAPFSLMLPFVDLTWTGILTFLIGLILSSAFSAIVVFAQELMPGKVGAVSGLFFGFAFGIGGIGAAVLGGLADDHGIEFVYRICAYLPLLGMVAAFLPNIEHRSPGTTAPAADNRADAHCAAGTILTHQLITGMAHYGLMIVVVNVLLDQIGFPVPAVPTLIVAGALAVRGQMSLPAVFAGSVLACLAADCGWYLVGQKYGIRVLKTLCKISLEPDSCVSQTQTRFESWGVNSLVIAKFIPGLAIIAPPLAGAMRIGWLRFILLSTCAAVLWVGAGLVAGILFKSQIARLLEHLADIGSVAGVGAAALLAAYIAYKWWERSRFYKMLRMARISVADLYSLIQAGAAPTVVDVRSFTARELEPRWIPGALHVPLQDVAGHLKDLARDREIVLYCTCPSEATAARVAKILMNHGFKRVRPLYGGLDAWVAAGYAVDTAAVPSS